MRILDRYIARQVLFTTATGVLMLTGVFVLGNLFKELDKILGQAELPASVIAKFVLYVMPGSLVYTIPWAFLTAVLLTFGRLSADNELISMRMGGLTTFRICLPVLLIAGALSAFCYWANVTLSPLAQQQIKSMFYREMSRDPSLLFQQGRVVDKLPGWLIYTQEKSGKDIARMYLFQPPKRENVSRMTMYAKEGQVTLSPDNSAIQLDFQSDFFLLNKAPGVAAEFQPIRSESSSLHIPLNDIIAKATEEKTSMKESHRIREELRLGIRADKNEPLTPQRRSEYLTELHKRLNFSFACITFALVGIPLGITAQRRETSVGFAVSLLIAVIYFFLFILADGQRLNPSAHPQWLMWIPNAIFLSIGLVLFTRLSRK